MRRHVEPIARELAAGETKPRGCPACGADGARPLLEKFATSMSRCNACGLVFTSPLPDLTIVESRYSDSWFESEYLPSYGIDPSDPRPEQLAARFDATLERLEPYRRLNRVLDVGAGAGLFLWHARRRGWRTEGVEISRFGPRFAKERFGLDIFEGALEDVRFEAASFDVVLLQDTLEHVPNPASVMARVNHLTREGGAVLISTPNFDGFSRRFMGDRWPMISPLEHLCLFTRDSLSRLLARNGFGVSKIETAAGSDGSNGTSYSRSAAKAIARLFGLGNELYCTAVKTGTVGKTGCAR